tara:strand:+ start:1139 stop:1975 length:837 start_codon:yes stop_codon:yes gene_type:complete
MVEYTCSACNKIFTQKGHYMRHINRKFPCTKKNNEYSKYSISGINIPNLEYKEKPKCIYCQKTYSTKYNLNKHYKTCNQKKEIDMKDKLYNLLIKENQKKLEEDNLFLKQQINNLQKQLNKDNTNIVISNNTNCNNKTINILAYNKTDLSHLSDKDFEFIMKKCYQAVPTLIEKTHFNPNKLENKNIYINNIQNKFVMIYNGIKWNLVNREDTINDIYENSSNILEDKIENWEVNKYKYSKIAVDKFYKFLDNKDKDKIKNKVKDEIKLILYNNRIID